MPRVRRRGRRYETLPRYEPLETNSRPIFQLKITVSGTNYAALSSTSPDGTAFFIVRIRCFQEMINIR